MADTGWINLTSGTTSDDYGDADWSNPSNALADDGSFASVSLDGLGGPFTSYFLQVRNGDFSAIPDGSTINGLEFKVRALTSSGAALGNAQFYRNSDATWYETAVSFSSALTSTETEFNGGGATDLCGTTWAKSDITSTNFGVRFLAQNPDVAEDVRVDYVAIKVYYTAGGGGGGQPYIARVSGVPGARLGGASFGRGW